MNVLDNNPTLENLIYSINNDLATTSYVEEALSGLTTKINSSNISDIIVANKDDVTITIGETSLTTGYLLLLYQALS